MKIFKNIYSVFINSVFMMIFISTAFAGDTCVQCGGKDVKGAPNVSLNGLEKDAMLAGQTKNPDSSFLNYLDGYCMKFEHIEKNELNQMIRDLKETGYPVDDFFTKAGCRLQKLGGTKSPMLHLAAEAPCSRVEYPQIIYKYYAIKRKDPKLWLEVVNAKNTKGETYLDYIENLNKQNQFLTTDARECADQLIAFACKTGAVYSKVSKSCPTRE
jgi:hypothetical protein